MVKTLSYYIIRNHTIEPLFQYLDNVEFSEYNSFKIDKKFSVYCWFFNLPFKQNIQTLIKEIDSYKEQIKIIISELPSDSVFLTFSLQNHYDLLTNNSLTLEDKINEFNQWLFRLTEIDSRIKFININKFTRHFSFDILFDYKYFYTAGIYYNPKLYREFQLFFNQQINSVFNIRKKCIILDLDNTLWGGIIGEEGVYNIQLGDTYPGNCFKDFQIALKIIKETGVILCICSKNNIIDIEEYWKNNINVVLKSEDFVIKKINWNNKIDNIKEIVNELNISMDSILFIDDSPSERELVRAFLPEIEAPSFPEKPYELVSFITKIFNQHFFSFYLTTEDLKKTNYYHQNNERNKYKLTFDTIKDFINSLLITIELQHADDRNIARIAQLTQKTNQFNLTTKRYNESEIRNLLNNNAIIYCAKISDKFGDNGITCVAIIKTSIKNNSIAEIDTFLLSCRILGKGIEDIFCKVILNKLFEKGFTEIIANYIPTIKNKQTEFFYETNDFKLIEENNLGIKSYKIKLRNKFTLDKNYLIIYK